VTGPVEAFPLTWPPNRPRTRQPENSRFKVTLSAAIKAVQDEVYLLGGRERPSLRTSRCGAMAAQ
jgi:hypothetical protein